MALHSGFLLMRNLRCANKSFQKGFILTNIGKINFWVLFIKTYLFKMKKRQPFYD